jgi:probable HAF family extracellular repeat protein
MEENPVQLNRLFCPTLKLIPRTNLDTIAFLRPRETGRRLQWILFVLWILTICFAPAAFAQSRYQITRIPTAQDSSSTALGINNQGDVVGYSFKGQDYQGFLYSSSDQSLTDVGSLGGQINAACAINDAGQVTGYSEDANGNLLAFLYSRSQPMASLGALDNASTSEAFGINSRGTVVGDSQSGTRNHRPAIFSDGSVKDLGVGGSNDPNALETAYAINESGQIVGRHSVGENVFHAFAWVNGNTTDLSTLGGANGEALAVNKNGQVVGDSDTTEGPVHAFIFDHSQLKDLGTLPGFDNASYARGINNGGDIVGESDSADQKRAFLYTKGQLIELDKLVENLSEAGFISLDVAYGINDKGWIVGYGTTSDSLTGAFVAVPKGKGDQVIAGGVQKPPVPRQAAPAPQPQEDAGPGPQVSEPDEENYDVFYNGLSSDEGNWVEAGDYGYCFRPHVSKDWRPYRDGHWVWTDHGWYWSSNERFAWATYHYGRWANIGGTGWCWVPGNRWAPAWVSWRQSDQEVGWAPLPPEAEVSRDGSISSWSDSRYDIGPAAYAFIRFSRWHEPSYARYVEPPERNIQIINQTKNVTNIVTNNNVINNFGPPVQTVATRTNRNIQQVNLALTPATGPRANFGQTLRGNQLTVVTPTATLKPQATHAPPVQNQIPNPRIHRGWQGVKPQEAAKLRTTIAEQNPPPKDQPKPTPFVKPQIGNRGQPTGPTAATPGTPSAVVGPKTPPGLVKPGAPLPTASVIPSAPPKAATSGRKPLPPNLLGPKASAGAPPKVVPSATAGVPPKPAGKPTTASPPVLKPSSGGNGPGPAGPKGTPPNLMAPKPSTTPALSESPRHPEAGGPTPKPADNPPAGQNTPRALATPDHAVTPNEKRTPEAATPAPQTRPSNLPTPKPPQEVKPAPPSLSAPSSTPVSAPHPQPVAPSQPTPEVKAVAPPKQELKTPSPRVPSSPPPGAPVKAQPPQVHPAAAPAKVRHSPSAQPAAPAPKPERPAPKPEPVHKSAPPAPKSAPATPRPAPATPKPAPAVHKSEPPARRPAPPAPRPAPAAPKPASPAAKPAGAAAKPAPQHGGQKPAPAKGKPTPSP